MKILSRNSIFIIAGLGLAAGITWSMWPGKGSTKVDLNRKRYGQVKRGDLIQRVTVSGQIQPARRSVFVAPYAGYVYRMYVTIGKKVKRGDPIVSISPSLSGSEQVYPIRAPFDGVVVDVQKQEGEYVSEKDQKDVIVRIDDLSRYFVVAKSPELDAARIRKDMEVEVRVNAIRKTILKGIVRDIDLAAEEADGWRAQQSTFDVRVEVLNPPSDIRSGQTAILDIVTDRYEDVLYLGHEFINQDGDKHFVVTRNGDTKYIEVGRQSDMAVEITKGLKEGDWVEQIDFLKLLEGG